MTHKALISGTVKLNGQPVQGAMMSVWAIRGEDRRDWGPVYTNANGAYAHSWEADTFSIPWSDNHDYYNRCLFIAGVNVQETDVHHSVDPGQQNNPENHWVYHTQCTGYPYAHRHWYDSFSFRTK